MWPSEKHFFELCMYRAAGDFPSVIDRIKCPDTDDDTTKFTIRESRGEGLSESVIVNLLVVDRKVVNDWFKTNPKQWKWLHHLYLALEEGGDLYEQKAPRYQKNLEERMEFRQKHEDCRKRKREQEERASLARRSSSIFDGGVVDDEVEDIVHFRVRLNETTIDHLNELLNREVERQKNAAERAKIITEIIRVKSRQEGVQEVQERLDADLTCPITQSIIEDPVVAADGITYERTAIEDWFRREQQRIANGMGDPQVRSPSTNTPLPNTNLQIIYNMRRMVQGRQ